MRMVGLRIFDARNDGDQVIKTRKRSGILQRLHNTTKVAMVLFSYVLLRSSIMVSLSEDSICKPIYLDMFPMIFSRWHSRSNAIADLI